ncbi:MAG: OmpH family outer membrane protein [Puniceicoccales bacterium]|nr:OmpH family outer membrane protein [Puniceicoccales bacterium]
MRKLVVFLCVGSVGAMCLSALDSGKTKVNTPAAPVATVPKNKDIAIVYASKIQSKYHKVEALNDILKKNVDAVQKELISMLSEFEKVRKEHQELVNKAKNPALTEEAQKKIQAEADDKSIILKQKENAILDFKNNSESRISKIGAEESAKIVTEVRQKIGNIAKDRGILVVLDADGPGVLYAEETLDMTDDVLEILNADQPKSVVTETVTPIKR